MLRYNLTAKINEQFCCYDLGVSARDLSHAEGFALALARTRVVLPGWVKHWHTLVGCDAQEGERVSVRMERDASSEDYGDGDNLVHVFRFVRRGGVWVEDAEE